MTRRANQNDTEADRELYACINSSPPRSFLMIAGAGSGKTTSLIKGIGEILDKHGERLKLRRQRVACITYTEVAAEEIWSDVKNNSLVNVSTIHSFLWSLVRTFQSDIAEWVAIHVRQEIDKLDEKIKNFGPRVQQRTRDKSLSDLVRFNQQLAEIGNVPSYTYGTGSNYVDGILGHDDVIKMVPQIILERPLMRTILAQQYPFLFVDESQDTSENVVLALKAVEDDPGNRFCLGFFGDPMQSIYPTGVGTISPGPNWASIRKPENFRCPTSVLNVANAIRKDGDGLIQTSGRKAVPDSEHVNIAGNAHLFILPCNENRDKRIAQVRAWTAEKTDDLAWTGVDGKQAVKLLVIVHRMAARRLGFGELYAALNDKAPDKFKNGFLDGTAWPIRPFSTFVLPLVIASKNGNEFDAIRVLREKSPLLDRKNLGGVDVAEVLSSLRRFTMMVQQMLDSTSVATNSDVLRLICEYKVIDLDPRLHTYLKLAPQAEKAEPDGTVVKEDDGEELTKEVSAMEAFLACPASQFLGYFNYVNDDSPFSTQHGIKGAEFERVLIVLDDEEGTHVQFSYEKFLGIKPLGERDHSNQREGNETTVERTRRLFYVCCTRALKDLVVVLFTSDVKFAHQKISSLGFFPLDAIHFEEAVANY